MKMILASLYPLKSITGFCSIAFASKLSLAFCMNCCLCRVTEEADLISEQLNLRLTAQGLLTGDMQLLLPPSGGIYLDPYTGWVQ